MIEFENVKEALKALYLLNCSSIEHQDPYTGEVSPAKASDIQELNLEVVYQIADLLGIDYDELEPTDEGWD